MGWARPWLPALWETEGVTPKPLTGELSALIECERIAESPPPAPNTLAGPASSAAKGIELKNANSIHIV